MNRLFARTTTGTIATSNGAPPSGIIHTLILTDTGAGSVRVQDAGGSVDLTVLVLAGDTTVVPLRGVAYSGTLTLTLAGTAPKVWVELGV